MTEQAMPQPPVKDDRLSWDDYFMEITRLVSKRATCTRRAVGAILVKDKRIIATGYNGPPRGIRHCRETGCLRTQLNIPSGTRHEICRGLHGEQNAIIQAAIHGVSIEGATLYCTTQPCIICAKMLINAGIRIIKYEGKYPDELSLSMLQEAGIELVRLTQPGTG